jgi:hypothetical protein
MKPTPKPKFDYDAWTWNAAAQAAESGHTRMMRDPWTAVYLYCKPGSVTTRPDGDDPCDMGYQLVTAERLPLNMDRNQLMFWIHDRLVRAPCLPDEVRS